MNIHEHQAKELLASQNVKVAKGFPAFSVNEAIEVAERIGGPIWVVKAQIHAGGRGKAGGVKVVKSIKELEEAAKEILGKTLITPQTGPSGKEVKRLYIEEGCDIKKESVSADGVKFVVEYESLGENSRGTVKYKKEFKVENELIEIGRAHV